MEHYERNPSTSSPPQESESINVLVVGETQQGKSTLIRRLSEYAGRPELGIEIGNGNLSCTRDVGQYNLRVPIRKFKLSSLVGENLDHKSFTELCRLKAHQARVVEDEASISPMPTAFTFIDTPGMDDSGDRDLEIMASILSRIADMKYINAIIYVRSVDTAFGATFRQFFEYMQQCMPSICNGMIVVHTSFSTDKVREYLRDEKSLATLRREAFKASTNLDLLHYFMDNDPDPDRPFAVLESRNEAYRLFSMLTSQQPIPARDLRLIKTKSMNWIESYVASAVTLLKSSLEHRREASISSARTSKQETIRKVQDIASKRSLLNTTKEQLQDLNNDSVVHMGSKDAFTDYGIWDDLFMKRSMKLPDRPMEFTALYTITRIDKTQGSGCRWQNETHNDKIWKGTLKANRFTNIEGSVTFYTSKAIQFRERISHLQVESARLEGQLEMLQQTFGTHEDLSDDTGMAEIEGHTKLIEACKSLLSEIDKRTCDINDFRRLKYLYQLQEKPKRDEIFRFIQHFDPELANGYWREIN